MEESPPGILTFLSHYNGQTESEPGSRVQVSEAQARAHWLARLTFTGTGNKTVFSSLPLRLRRGVNGVGEKWFPAFLTSTLAAYTDSQAAHTQRCVDGATLSQSLSLLHAGSTSTATNLGPCSAQLLESVFTPHPRQSRSPLSSPARPRRAAVLKTGCDPPLRPVQGALRGPLNTEGQIITTPALELPRACLFSLQAEAHIPEGLRGRRYALTS